MKLQSRLKDLQETQELFGIEVDEDTFDEVAITYTNKTTGRTVDINKDSPLFEYLIREFCTPKVFPLRVFPVKYGYFSIERKVQ